MANGDALSVMKSNGIKTAGNGYKLLDQSATSEGEWVQVGHLKPISIEIFGTFIGSVQIHASNQDTKPAANYEGATIGTVTTPSIVVAPASFRWVKAKPALSSGSVSAYAHGVT